MPWKIRKVQNKNCYEVVNISNNRVRAVCTTLQRAQNQVALLNALYEQEIQNAKESKQEQK